MLSKCANPTCGSTFHYFREGKLYQFEINLSTEDDLNPQQGVRKPVRKVEHFWLCGRCAASMSLALEGQRKVVVVPFNSPEMRRAAAS